MPSLDTSDPWDQSNSSALPREFLVSVEVYISNTASAALRKVSTGIVLPMIAIKHFVVATNLTQENRTSGLVESVVCFTGCGRGRQESQR
jgi:Na+-transporting NADH:ubiquinone oxidoreductase subunit NqrE